MLHSSVQNHQGLIFHSILCLSYAIQFHESAGMIYALPMLQVRVLRANGQQYFLVALLGLANVLRL